jgi:hypothetical protein
MTLWKDRRSRRQQDMTSKWDDIYIFERPTSTGRKAAAVRVSGPSSVPWKRAFSEIVSKRA